MSGDTVVTTVLSLSSDRSHKKLSSHSSTALPRIAYELHSRLLEFVNSDEVPIVFILHSFHKIRILFCKNSLHTLKMGPAEVHFSNIIFLMKLLMHLRN